MSWSHLNQKENGAWLHLLRMDLHVTFLPQHLPVPRDQINNRNDGRGSKCKFFIIYKYFLHLHLFHHHTWPTKVSSSSRIISFVIYTEILTPNRFTFFPFLSNAVKSLENYQPKNCVQRWYESDWQTIFIAVEVNSGVCFFLVPRGRVGVLSYQPWMAGMLLL